MATFYGVNATKYLSGALAEGKQSGKGIHHAYDKFASVAVTAGDTINLMKLPKGAVILNAHVVVPDQGTTGTLSLGIAANGVDSAAPAGLMALTAVTADVHYDAKSAATKPACMFQEVGAETQVVLTVGTAWDAAAGLIEVSVEYAL